MHRLAPRDLLKTAGVAGGLAAIGLPSAPVRADTTTSPRSIVPLDRGWRFHLGHASDPAKDFGFGGSHDTYGKSGDVGTPIAEAKYDDGNWQAIDLPHDW